MTGHFQTRGAMLGLAAAFAVLLSATASAQSPTGTMTGRVTDSQGDGIPGVTVTIESPAMQGTQQAVTSSAGDYIFKFLPPGAYTATFRIQGFGEARYQRTVAAAEPVSLDVSLLPARVQEMVTVTADAGAFVHTVEGATTVKQSLLNSLPGGRDILGAVNLAPSAHATGPAGAYSMAGSMSFDSLYMVNGVPVQENLRGAPRSLYIEDAIQETTVMTSGIPAEYGRFSGGIVNVTTKSGGNLFSGSFRTSVNNDNWRSVSPFGETKLNDTVPTYEATVGGPLVRDGLWLFGAFRSVDSTVRRETGFTRVPFDRRRKENRFELKATQSLGRGRRLEANYVGLNLETTNAAWPSTAEVMDLASLTNPKEPESLVGVHYTSTVGSRLFLEAQYSARRHAFKRSGGLSTDLIAGTPFLDQQTGAWWWSPHFCGVCTDEERGNSDLLVKGSYFLSTRSGAHDVTFGYDGYNDKVRADIQQSGSDFHVWATASTFEGGEVYPVIEPGSTWIVHWPVQAASKGSNFRTHSLFLNDRWAFNRYLSLNLGVRFDKNSGRDSSDRLVSTKGEISPRLGLVWDPNGSGRTSLSLSAGRYVSSLSNSIAGSASGAGNPSILAYFYEGDPINNEAGPLVSSGEALGRIFAWFNAAQPVPFHAEAPGVSTIINRSFGSPHADEFAVGLSRQLGSRASVRVDVVDRKYSDFYSSRIDTSTGVVFDDFGTPYDLKVIENTNALSRRYRAMNVQAGYNGLGVTMGAAYTLSRLWGNVDGEDRIAGPLSADLTAYPEYNQPRWVAPEGDLAADQRHRFRGWAEYRLPWGREIATFSIGALQNFESGTPYGAVGTAIVSPFVDNPGYMRPPDTQAYYLTPRDAFRTDSAYRTDLLFNVARAFPGARRSELFANFQLLNVFNRFQAFKLTGGEINTAVATAFDDSQLEIFDPFSDVPVEGVHWMKHEDFGKPVARGAYTVPRTFSFSVGVRF